jgi:hypothetical protein
MTLNCVLHIESKLVIEKRIFVIIMSQKILQKSAILAAGKN